MMKAMSIFASRLTMLTALSTTQGAARATIWSNLPKACSNPSLINFSTFSFRLIRSQISAPHWERAATWLSKLSTMEARLSTILGMIRNMMATMIPATNSRARAIQTARFRPQSCHFLNKRRSRKRMGILAIKAMAMPINRGCNTLKKLAISLDTAS